MAASRLHVGIPADRAAQLEVLQKIEHLGGSIAFDANPDAFTDLAHALDPFVSDVWTKAIQALAEHEKDPDAKALKDRLQAELNLHHSNPKLAQKQRVSKIIKGIESLGGSPGFQKHTERPRTEQLRLVKPHPEKPHPEKPHPEKPQPDKPHPEKPHSDKPQPDKPHSEKPHPDKPQPDKPHPVKPQPGKPHPEQPHPDKPHPAQPHPAQPHPDKPHPDKPHPEQPHPEKPHPDKPHPEKPHPDKPHPEKPHPDKPHPEKPHPEKPHPDKPHAPKDHEPDDGPSSKWPSSSAWGFVASAVLVTTAIIYAKGHHGEGYAWGPADGVGYLQGELTYDKFEADGFDMQNVADASIASLTLKGTLTARFVGGVLGADEALSFGGKWHW